MIKSISHQTLSGLEEMHKRGIIHRDMKPENLLVSDRNVVKIADFGLAKEVRSAPPFTDYVSTRWYRAPELLLKGKVYNTKIDIFALACIMVEMYLLAPLFAGENEMDQLHKIISVLGTPPKEWVFGHKQAKALNIKFKECEKISLRTIIPNASSHAIDMLEKMLRYDPVNRISATEALQHPYFTESIRTSANLLDSPKLTRGAMKSNQSEIFERNPMKQTNGKNMNNVTNLGAFDPDDSFGNDTSMVAKVALPKDSINKRSILGDLEPVQSLNSARDNHSQFDGGAKSYRQAKNFDDELDFFFSAPSKNKKPTPKPAQNYGVSEYLPMKKPGGGLTSFKSKEQSKFEVSINENYAKSKKDLDGFDDFDDVINTRHMVGKEVSAPVKPHAGSFANKLQDQPNLQPKGKTITFEDDDDWDDLATTKQPANRGFLY